MQSRPELSNKIYVRGLIKGELSPFAEKNLKCWQKGCALGFEVNMKNKTIEIFWNRVSLGIAWHNIPAKIIPAVSDGTVDLISEYKVRRIDSFDPKYQGFQPPLLRNDIYVSMSDYLSFFDTQQT